METYKRPYDPLRPVVCLDETSRQLIEERHIPVTEPGQIELVDYEYAHHTIPPKSNRVYQRKCD